MKLERFNLVEWATVAAIIVVVGAVLAGGAGFGCAGCRQAFSHVKSVTVGLNRKITVYGMDGKVIQQWTTNTNVEDKGGSFRFMVNGKAVQVAGTVVIEEQ